jgi:hypothetical protein
MGWDRIEKAGQCVEAYELSSVVARTYRCILESRLRLMRMSVGGEDGLE